MWLLFIPKMPGSKHTHKHTYVRTHTHERAYIVLITNSAALL